MPGIVGLFASDALVQALALWIWLFQQSDSLSKTHCTAQSLDQMGDRTSNSATAHESLNGMLSIESSGRPSDQKLPFHTLFGVPLTQTLKTSPTISAPSSY